MKHVRYILRGIGLWLGSSRQMAVPVVYPDHLLLHFNRDLCFDMGGYCEQGMACSIWVRRMGKECDWFNPDLNKGTLTFDSPRLYTVTYSSDWPFPWCQVSIKCSWYCWSNFKSCTPCTHHCWVARGNVGSKLCPRLLHHDWRCGNLRTLDPGFWVQILNPSSMGSLLSHDLGFGLNWEGENLINVTLNPYLWYWPSLIQAHITT